MEEQIQIKKEWIIERYNNEEEAKKGIVPKTIVDGNGNIISGTSKIKGNVLLNEGINNVLLPLLCGTGTPTAVYDNSNAYIGVGNDSATAEDATQTGLQGASTTYASMENGYPTTASQVATWKSSFGSTEANHDWNEFTIVNAADDTGDNFNRKVSNQGTKVSGQVWTIVLQITFS